MLCSTTELHVKILTKRDTREDATLNFSLYKNIKYDKRSKCLINNKKHISCQECTDFAQIGFTLQELLIHCNYPSGVPFRP